MTQNSERICAEVSKEFGPIYEQFRVINLTLDEALVADEEFIWHPGAYVFWNSAEVIKVGRHFTNARKRALEHIRVDTGGRMKALDADPNTNLLLLVVKNPDKLHWVAALEVFLETSLKPSIASKRLG